MVLQKSLYYISAQSVIKNVLCVCICDQFKIQIVTDRNIVHITQTHVHTRHYKAKHDITLSPGHMDQCGSFQNNVDLCILWQAVQTLQ